MAAARGGDGVGEANGGLGRLNQSDAGWTAFGVQRRFSAVLPVSGWGRCCDDRTDGAILVTGLGLQFGGRR